MTLRNFAATMAMVLLGTLVAGCLGRQEVEKAQASAARADAAALRADAAAVRCTNAAAACATAAQTKLCGPCTAAGCSVPGWPTAVCQNGKCRPICGGVQHFGCWITASGLRKAGCRPTPDCSHPERCP
jgi:hypothetical protein